MKHLPGRPVSDQPKPVITLAITTPVRLEKMARQVAIFLQKGVEGAKNTRTAYTSDVALLRHWLQQHQLADLPLTSATLATYLSDVATRHKWATITRRLAAIRQWHRIHGHPDPGRDEGITTLLEGIKRTIGTQPDQAPAFEMSIYKELVRLIPPTPTGIRDRALLLVGFAGAFRRSELVSLDVEGVQFTKKGAILTYRGSKTNQYGLTEQKALFFSPDRDTCPVRSLQDYLATLCRSEGPLFVRIRKGEKITTDRLSDKQVNRTTKFYIGEAYPAHSYGLHSSPSLNGTGLMTPRLCSRPNTAPAR